MNQCLSHNFNGKVKQVYLLVINGCKIGIKNFASLYVGVCKAVEIGLKKGQLSTHILCSLQEVQII